MLYQQIQSFFISVFVVLFTVYFLIGVFLYIKQRDFLYFPTESIKTEYLQKTFHINGEKIQATILNPKKDHAILYFGGNAEIVDYNTNEYTSLFEGYTTYLIKYRGYSGSSGEATQEGLFEDALAVYDEIQSEYKSVSIIGRSLGSGIAVWVASQREISRLVLVTPYDSITNVAQEKFKYYPIFLLLKDSYNSLAYIKDIKVKTLVLIAQNDKIISYERSQTLVKALMYPKTEIIANASHDDITKDSEYHKLLRGFFLETL